MTGKRPKRTFWGKRNVLYLNLDVGYMGVDICQNSSNCALFLFNAFLKFLFIYFWLHWVFVAAHGLSLVAASGGYSSLRCACFSLRWLLLLQSTGSRRAGFSSCGTCAQ